VRLTQLIDSVTKSPQTAAGSGSDEAQGPEDGHVIDEG
jgi:hypothetical protein